MVSSLKFVGIIVGFSLLLAESYSITSNFVPIDFNVLIVTLLVLTVLKDIADHYDFKSDDRFKDLAAPISTISLFATGILSSLALLIPKILYLEQNHLDSVRAKFGITVTRIWSYQEKSEFITEYLSSRNLSSSLISPQERIHLIDSNDSMSSLKEDLDPLVNGKLADIKEHTGLVSDLFNWCVEHPQVVTVGIAVVTTIVGYLVYTNSDTLNGLYKSMTETVSFANNQDKVNKSLSESIAGVVEHSKEVDQSLSDTNERLTGLFADFAKLFQSVGKHDRAIGAMTIFSDDQLALLNKLLDYAKSHPNLFPSSGPSSPGRGMFNYGKFTGFKPSDE